VVFLMRPSEYAASEIYSVPISGGAVTKLNENISTQVNTFLFTPDSQKVVYQAVVPIINQWGLYSVLFAGPATSSLRIDTNPSYHVDSGFKISPDSSRVVYRAPCTYGPDGGQACYGMYSAPVAGGPSAKLSLDGAYYSVASGIEISPDSQYVVYRGYYPPDWSFDIYSIPIAGATSDLLRLSHYIAGGVPTWQICPDSSRVVFIAMQDTAGTSELYSIPIRLTGIGS
jgi:Tol biopolymer transport system component